MPYVRSWKDLEPYCIYQDRRRSRRGSRLSGAERLCHTSRRPARAQRRDSVLGTPLLPVQHNRSLTSDTSFCYHDSEYNNTASTTEEASIIRDTRNMADDVIARMMADLGCQRREQISLRDKPGNMMAPVAAKTTKTIKPVGNSESTQHKAAISSWNIVADEADTAIFGLSSLDDGQAHRANKHRSHHHNEPSTYMSEERTLWLDQKRAAANSRYQLSASPRTSATPRHIPPLPSNIASRRRAPSPRAGGTARFVRDQQVEQRQLTSIQRTLNKAAAATSGRPVKTGPAPTPAAVPPPQHTSRLHLSPAQFTDYLNDDMSYTEVKSMMKMIFDPERGSWLVDKHRDILTAFDKIGRLLRAEIMKITTDAALQAFLDDFGFIPEIEKHIEAAKKAVGDASGGGKQGDHQNEKYYAEHSEYMPFYKMAQRIVAAKAGVKAPAPHGLELIELLRRNARAMLARSEMRPEGIVLRNGIYWRE